MKANSHSSTAAERTGERLGHAWRTFTRNGGALPAAAKGFVKLAGLAVLPLAAIVAAIARQSEEQQDWFPKPTDHRDEPFYDPLSYNDDPDPRFEDD